jgi:hypothetical protein
MASLWEILQPSNLRYDSSLGFTRADAGAGPPAGTSGWIRTGYDSFNSLGQTNTAGAANCLAYTTTAGLGSMVFLSTQWQLSSAPSPTVSPWIASAIACNVAYHVWCVQD